VQFGGAQQGVTLGGQFTAMNMSTNRKVWEKKFAGSEFQPNVQVLTSSSCQGSSLVTAGDVVFNPTPRREGKFIVAYDANNGNELWRYEMEASGNCPPMTYSVDEKQYLAVYACGNVGTVNPQVKGDALYVFTLP